MHIYIVTHIWQHQFSIMRSYSELPRQRHGNCTRRLVMKKILGIFASLIFGSMTALSANGWTNAAGFGWNLPMDFTFSADDYNNGEDVVLENQTGLEFFYMGIGENGFAVKGAFDLNYSGINHEINNTPFIGVNLNCQLGAGYAPINSEKFTLGLFGMIGLDASAFYSESTSYDSLAQKNITSEYSEGQIGYMLGGNVTAVYTPSVRFSLFASCSVNYVTPGIFLVKAEFCDVYADSEDYFETESSVKVIPTIGICWKL